MATGEGNFLGDEVLRVLVIAGLGGVLGFFLSICAAAYLTELYHVSNMEGGRGMLVLFFFGPLGFIVGSLLGVAVAIWKREAGYLAAQGLALGAVAGAVFLVSAIAFLLADHPPKLDGKSVALVFEIKVPPVLKVPEKLDSDSIRASLYATDRDNRYAILDYTGMAVRDGCMIIPGRAPLRSQTFHRHLLVSVGNDTAWPQVVKLKLRANPTKQDEVWSDWITATERADLSPVTEAERISVRYRVEPED